MKRVALFSFFLLACSSSADDDIVIDGSIDQTADTTVDAPGDVTKKDAAPDVVVDAATDGDAALDGSDASDASDAIADAIALDVITIDGGGCVDNTTCGAQEFCNKGTSNCGGIGACEALPQFCPQNVFPVCGCDKKTYNNSCYANKGRTSVAYTGTCE